jgi:uncharacterized protein (DUF697 family)
LVDLSGLSNVWKNVKEVDLRPLRQEAQRELNIVLAGREGTGRHSLARQMRRDPLRQGQETDAPLAILGLDEAQAAQGIDLAILLLDPHAGDLEAEKSLFRAWSAQGVETIVFTNARQPQTEPGNLAGDPAYRRAIYGPVEDAAFLQEKFVPFAVGLLHDHLLALGRSYPLFRLAIANRLINETSFSNAAYSLSTGLAEIVPVFDIPLNVADMVVLSKAQAFLVYRLGLALGLSTEWQNYVAEFGSVLGGGFLWRQLARGLIGLIPAWGIIPKVAVAYAGTYVVGHVVLQWYLTGRHVTRKQMNELYRQAFTRGKEVAGGLLAKMARPPRGRRKTAALPERGMQVCENCGRQSAADASFCQYCGQSFAGSGK